MAAAAGYLVKLRENRQSPFYTSWAEAWRVNAVQFNNPPIANPDDFEGDKFYLTYTRGALALATRLGIPEAR
jgi:hypothetical protein